MDEAKSNFNISLFKPGQFFNAIVPNSDAQPIPTKGKMYQILKINPSQLIEIFAQSIFCLGVTMSSTSTEIGTTRELRDKMVKTELIRSSSSQLYTLPKI